MTRSQEHPGEVFAVICSFADSLRLFRWHMLRELSERGYRVVAYAPDPTLRLVEEFSQIGVELRRYPLDRRGLNPATDAVSLACLTFEFRRLRPRYVFSYTVKPIVYGSLAARSVGCRNVYSMVEGLGFAFDQTSRASLLRRFLRSVMSHAIGLNRGVVFLNPDDEREFDQRGLLGGATAHTVIDGTGVDLQAFTPEPLPDTPAFVFVGRLLIQKGVREYIAAARQFREKGGEARFLIVGWHDDSPEMLPTAELEAAVAGGVVEFFGAVEDVRPILAQASALVLPSYYREGVPRSALEAMAMGRAVVTTDNPGCRETVRHGVNGFLIPPRDPDALVRAMLDLSENREQLVQFGLAGRRYAEQRFCVHAVNRALLGFLGVDAEPARTSLPDEPLRR